MSKLHDILQPHVDDGSVPGAVGLVARGDRVEVEAAGSVDVGRHRPDGQGFAVPYRLDHQADHRRGGDDAGRGRPARAGRPDRPVAAGAGLAEPSSARRPARSTTWCRPSADHRGRSAHLPRRVRLPVRLLAAGGRAAVHRAASGTAAADARRRRRTSGWPRCPASRCCPARRGVAVQHVLRHPGRADRPGLRPSLPEFLAERVFAPLGMADTGFDVPAGKLDRFTSYYRAGPAGGLELVDAPDGQWSSRPRSRPAPAVWCLRSTTGRLRPDAAGGGAAARCCRPTRCG